MTRSYTLNPQAAKQAGVSSYINETGPYVGVFKRAEAVVSKQKTDGIEFTFLSDDGRTCDFLNCWTYNEDGKELYGLKMLNALMACMRVRDIAPIEGSIRDRDGNTKKTTIFPELMDKPIGVLLQREEYEKNDGSIGFKFNIVGSYEAKSGMTASEILDKATKPVLMEQMVARLKDKPMQQRREPAARPATQAGALVGSGFDDMSDDIPFADPYKGPIAYCS